MARRRTGRLTRYLLAELAGPTVLGLLLYSFLLLMNAFFLVARVAIAKNLGWDLTFQLFVLEIPKTLILSIPMATLLGTMIGLGRISADHEWTALQGAGLGPGFLLRPVLLHGLIATLAAALVYGFVFPVSNYRARTLSGRVLMASNLTSDLAPRVFHTDVPGMVVYADEILPGGSARMDGVLIYKAPEPDGPGEQLILSRAGDLSIRPDGSGGLDLRLSQGVLHEFRAEDPETYRDARFGTYEIPVDPPSYFEALRKPPPTTVQDMTPPDLLDELERAAAEREPAVREYAVRRTELEIHRRAALPLASLIFAFLALPLGLTRVRSGKGAGFALSLGVIALYWVVFTLALEQATQGRIPAWAGAWTANLGALAWAGIAYARLRRRTGDPGGGRLGRWIREFARRDWAGSRRSRRPSADLPPPPAPRTTGGRVVSLVDRYVAVQFVRVLVYAVVSAYVIYTIVEFKAILEKLLDNRQPLSQALTYLKYVLPGMATWVLPVACLVAGTITFTILSRTGELTALKAGGISMRRATLPVLVLTAVVCGLFFLVQDRIAPETNRRAQEVKDRIQGRNPRTYGMPPGGRWTFGAGGRLYHYRLYDPQARSFQGLSVLTVDLRTPRILEHRFAATAAWDGATWVLRDGWERTFPAEGPATFLRYAEDRLALDPPDNFARREIGWTSGSDLPEQLSLADLGEQIEALAHSGYDTTRLRVAYWAKTAQPFTPLVMVLLGLPFALRVGRRGSLYGVGVAILLVIVYWATLATFSALGSETILPPVLAAWAPNVLYAIAGAYVFLFVRT